MRKFIRELFGLFLLFWSLLLALALFSFDAGDPSFNLVKTAPYELNNKAGLFGAYSAGFLNDFFGIGALLWPVIFAVIGVVYLRAHVVFRWWRWCGLFLLTLCLLMAASSLDLSIGDLYGGGMIGNTLYINGGHFLSPAGSFIAWLFILLAGLQLSFNFSWLNALENLKKFIKKYWPSLKDPSSLKASCWRSQLQAKIGKIDFLKKFDFKKFLAGAKIHIGQLINKKSEKKPESSFPMLPESPHAVESREIFTLNETSPVETADAEDSEFSPENDVSSSHAEKETKADVIEAQEIILEESPPAVEHSPVAIQQLQTVNVSADAKSSQSPSRDRKKYKFPSPDLLNAAPPIKSASLEDLQKRGSILLSCFNDFDIQGKLVQITPGPVVTMYEFRPAPGIRVNKIANLSDDLALALKAVAIRIQAPIPGSDTIGIEIPNDERETVNFRELAVSDPFRNGCGPLTMILGKDIAGRPYMADLTKMPHLLVAGATGAGKSVCLNSILVSLLYRVAPHAMRLLLVDPKRIEMAVYADLPHLVHPVVTEMSDAKNALEWAVQEMERRYQCIARLGVRNIAAYNQKLSSYKNNLPEDIADLQHLPYLVIVIDELADLMMTAAREVETSIVRLAQLARAAGIHMILATQRPSVDVVTGLIKANFPCRISFQVTSKHDSRTILDQVGAEHLLGRGDMLFKPSGGRLQRLHGPFLTDEEVQAVTDHWRAQMAPNYEVDFANWGGDGQTSSGGVDATSDALYNEARQFVLDQGRASISLLQRRFQIGFNRAARLMDQFKTEGIIGSADGNKPRSVHK